MKRLEELQAGIFLIRDTADEWETNYFISGEQAGAWIDHNEVTGVLFSDCFFIVRERNDFLHLYFVAVKSRQFMDDLLALQKFLGQCKMLWDTLA